MSRQEVQEKKDRDSRIKIKKKIRTLKQEGDHGSRVGEDKANHPTGRSCSKEKKKKAKKARSRPKKSKSQKL